MKPSHPLPETNKSLILRLRDRTDNHSWNEFTAVYAPLLLGFCIKSGCSEADAADISQNALVQVLTSIERFEYDPRKGTFRGWLGKIVWREMNRHRRRSQAIAEKPLPVPEFAGETAAAWTDSFNAHLLQTAMTRIRPEFDEQVWTAFEQTWLHNHPSQSVAESLGRPIGWLYKARYQVLTRLESEVRLLAEDCPFRFS